MKATKPTSCYFTGEERREIERIADATERTNSKVIQFAVRAFARLFDEDPKRAMELAQRTAGAN